MFQRSIAAVVLVTVGWLSVPLPLTPAQMVTMHRAHQKARSAPDHSCCPGMHPRIAPALLAAINSSPLPCGPLHPCCVQRAPVNPSNMPVEAKIIRPTAERVLTLAADTWPSARRAAIDASAAHFLAPPFELGTVLRI